MGCPAPGAAHFLMAGVHEIVNYKAQRNAKVYAIGHYQRLALR